MNCIGVVILFSSVESIFHKFKSNRSDNIGSVRPYKVGGRRGAVDTTSPWRHSDVVVGTGEGAGALPLAAAPLQIWDRRFIHKV